MKLGPAIVRTLSATALVMTGCAHTPPARPEPVAIVQAGEPVLRSRAREVAPDEYGTPGLHALVDRMIAAMRAAPGVGLAAPQIGVSRRIFVLEDTPALMSKLTERERDERERIPFETRVFVNPVVTPIASSGSATFFEGCLSVKGYAALVTRALEVEVSGVDAEGRPQVWRVRGWPARILQHELDHLDGTLYVDRMHTRSLSTPEALKTRFAGRPIAEILETLRLTPATD
jgi:peptide deformylase